METKKKLLFLGFSYHEKTGSADFMIKLLGRQFSIEFFRDTAESERLKAYLSAQGV